MYMSQKNLKLAMFGPQGSGKGTQADLLSKKFKIPAIPPGEILRQEIKKNTALGKKVKKHVLRGCLSPQSLVNQLVKKRLARQKSFILDGYPRSLFQARYLNEIVKLDWAILIQISKKEVLKRMSARRACPQCGATYNLIFKKPEKQGLCDKCQTKLIQRADDKPKVIKKRLSIYKKQTQPVLDLYRKMGILVKINGEQSIKNVNQDILKILK